jgi:quercetin dioxygenase-like cupin family protein
MSDWVQHAEDIAVEQPAPHGGPGVTIAAPFFADVPGLELVARQRTLMPGAAIGAHRHVDDEIYYVVRGAGTYTLDGVEHPVRAGHALLVRKDSTHALAQSGDVPLVIVVIKHEPR